MVQQKILNSLKHVFMIIVVCFLVPMLIHTCGGQRTTYLSCPGLILSRQVGPQEPLPAEPPLLPELCDKYVCARVCACV